MKRKSCAPLIAASMAALVALSGLAAKPLTAEASPFAGVQVQGTSPSEGQASPSQPETEGATSAGAGATSGAEGGANNNQSPEAQQSASWQKNDTGWWWQYSDGTYPVSKWELINGDWYYFDESGYMVEGWLRLGDTWYYLNPGSGAMAEGWLLLGDTWYYLNPGSGAMATGWLQLGDTWYFLYEDGSMASNTVVDGYTLDASGAWVQDANQGQTGGSSIVEGWVQSGDLWWYQNADGSYPASEWKLIDGKWYYFDESGWMVTGWRQVGGTWYFLYEDGSMASNTVVDGYTLDASGAWVQNAIPGPGAPSISEGESMQGSSSGSQSSAEGSTYVLNKNTGKFHKPGCRYAKNASGSNWVTFNGSRQEVIGMGYDPCQVCNP